MSDIIKYGSRYYSISDANDKHEYIVLKVRLKKDNTRIVEDARVIEAPSTAVVKQMIRNRPFTFFRKLPHEREEFNPDKPQIIQ